jgi:hypothetical protein
MSAASGRAGIAARVSQSLGVRLGDGVGPRDVDEAGEGEGQEQRGNLRPLS